jgi:hypothetical protein
MAFLNLRYQPESSSTRQPGRIAHHQPAPSNAVAENYSPLAHNQIGELRRDLFSRSSRFEPLRINGHFPANKALRGQVLPPSGEENSAYNPTFYDPQIE